MASVPAASAAWPAVQVRILDVRDADGGTRQDASYSAAVSLGTQGYTMGRQSPRQFVGGCATQAMDLHVYDDIQVPEQPVLRGAARVSLEKLSGRRDSSETAAHSWWHSWVALQKHRTFAGSIHIGALFGSGLTGAEAMDASTEAIEARKRCSYEDMVEERQTQAWDDDRRSARATLVDLVRAGGIPHSLRGHSWLSLSGARHRKCAAGSEEYAEWVNVLQGRSWRSDHALSTQLHTIRKDLPRTFPDDNIYVSHPYARA